MGLMPLSLLLNQQQPPLIQSTATSASGCTLVDTWTATMMDCTPQCATQYVCYSSDIQTYSQISQFINDGGQINFPCAYSDTNILFKQSASDGNTCPEIITQTYDLWDNCGNYASCDVVITINDTVPPSASNPSLLTVECIADVPAPDILVVTDEADNCTTNPTVLFVSDISDNNTCPETITRTYSVTDDCGNTINVTQSIVIHDTTAPTADALPDLGPYECYANIPAASINDVTGETDNCGGTVTVAFVSDSADPGCSGTVTRTYSLTDACGNSANITQNITIDDNTAPTADALPDLGPYGCYALIPAPDINDVTGEADNCGGAVTVAFVGDSADPGCSGTVTRTYSISDACGNSLTITQNILLNDNIPPTITCPTALNLVCNIGESPCPLYPGFIFI